MERTETIGCVVKGYDCGEGDRFVHVVFSIENETHSKLSPMPEQ